MMPYYVISNVTILDAQKHGRYSQAGTPAVAKYGGRFLVKGGAPEALEGEWQPQRMTIVEFDTAEAARAFYNSPEYQGAREFRRGAAEFNLVLVEGAHTEEVAT
jgi:uncharacterized protein (DUF1330 family)